MRIICHLFFIIFACVLFEIQISASEGNDNDIDIGNEAIIDTKLVEEFYDSDNDDSEDIPIHKKQRSNGMRNFVGTNLFYGDGTKKTCFSSEDIALLAARRDFESLIPKDLPNCLLDDELAKLLMQYFYGASQVINQMTRGHSKTLAQKAFYDTLGGYLQYYMIPIAKYSFYGGLVKLRTVQNILDLCSQSKEFLNTYGNGWRPPLTDFSDLDIKIESLRIVTSCGDDDTSCSQLDLLDEKTGEVDDMIVALPRLDPEEKGLLRNIWLPFKRKRTFDLQSSRSAFILLRYFELTTRCYKFQKLSQDYFNKRFRDWLLENVELHLKDSEFYPGLGAVLRIIETLRKKRKEEFVIEAKPTETRRERTGNSDNRVKNRGGSLNVIFDTDNPSDSDQTYQRKKCRKKRNYIYIAIAVAVGLVLLVFCCLCCAIFGRRKSQKQEKPPPPEPEPKPSLFGWLCCKKKQPKEDEKPLIDPKKNGDKDKERTKEKEKEKEKDKDKPKDKDKDKDAHKPSKKKRSCCGMCPSKTEKSGPAIIETSSMESDSGKDTKKKQKSRGSLTTTATVVDERRRSSQLKPSSRRGSIDLSESSKNGILKK